MHLVPKMLALVALKCHQAVWMLQHVLMITHSC